MTPRCWLKWPASGQSTALAAGRHTPRQRFRRFLKLESRELWLILGYAIAMGVLSLGVPIASQSLVNNVALGTLRQPLVVLCVVLLIVLGFLALLRSLQLILVEMLQRRIFVRLTQASVERLLRLQGLYREQKRIPELVNRFLDVANIQKSLSFLLLDGLALFLQALTGMLLLAFYHPFLLGFDLILLACIVFILGVLGLGGESSSIKESSSKYAMVAWLEELAAHPALFHSYSESIRAEIATARVTLNTACQQIEVARQESDLALQLAAAERERFALGGSDLFIVNLREQSAADAQDRLQEALSAYFLAEGQYMLSLGLLPQR